VDTIVLSRQLANVLSQETVYNVQSVLATVMDRLPVELSVERQTTPGTPLIGKVPASTQGSGNPAYHAETSNGCNGSIRCERAKLPSRNL
jgi:hypothetical protein